MKEQDDATHGRKPSEVIAARVKDIRDQRKMSLAKLAARCAELGAPRLNQGVLTNLEVRGRQDIGVTEWLVLAAALEVPPATLLIDVTPEPLEVTPSMRLYAPGVLEWLKGTGLPPEWAMAPDSARNWFASNARLRLVERFTRAFVDVDDGVQVAEFAQLVNEMIENDVFPPPLAAPLLAEMRRRGFRYGDQVRTAPDDQDGPGGART